MHNVLDGYSAAATPQLIAAYDGLPVEVIYQYVIDLFPTQPAAVADIGAGTGRDAAWFADRRHNVLAVEPVLEFRQAGQSIHPHPKIIWLNDRLPHLSAVQGAYNLVTMSGVWQHLPDADRALAMPNLARIIAPGGLLVLSLRHGPGAESRPVFPVQPDVTIALAEVQGLSLQLRQEAASVGAANRAADVTWTWLAFRKTRLRGAVSLR